MEKISQEKMDTLFEAVVDIVVSKDGKTIADLFYVKNPEFINQQLNIKSKDDFISYVERAKSMSMKMAEFFIDNLVNVSFKTAKRLEKKEIQKIVVENYDKSFEI